MNPSETSEHLAIYLRMLAHGTRPTEYFDVRWKTAAGGMHRRFVSSERVGDAAATISWLASSTDVYVGVALRTSRTYGGKSAIAGSRLLYVDCDAPDVTAGLIAGVPAPTMVVASGSPGHVQMYWMLDRRIGAEEIESANCRLAAAVGGDPSCVDAVRILRAPGTFNYKSTARRPVSLIEYRPQARYGFEELIASLPTPRPQKADSLRPPKTLPGGHALIRRTQTKLDRALLAIPANDYVRTLAGREASTAGKVTCPFHDDEHPSLQLYPGGSFYCFGCQRGGTIYDFAAHLWGVKPRGVEFLELRSRLGARFSVG